MLAVASWDNPRVGSSDGNWLNQTMEERADETRVALQLRDAGKLTVFGSVAHLADRRAFVRHLSRYTHRVAISDRRLISFDKAGVTFRYKDYRRRPQIMTLATDEFIRRFLNHVLPKGFHRIRHYGLLAGSSQKVNIARARDLLNAVLPSDHDVVEEPIDIRPPAHAVADA
nr:transposase [Marinicella sp. W31]MDC2876804.1 transposase [Marinicella sp. W31]